MGTIGPKTLGTNFSPCLVLALTAASSENPRVLPVSINTAGAHPARLPRFICGFASGWRRRKRPSGTPEFTKPDPSNGQTDVCVSAWMFRERKKRMLGATGFVKHPDAT